MYRVWGIIINRIKYNLSTTSILSDCIYSHGIIILLVQLECMLESLGEFHTKLVSILQVVHISFFYQGDNAHMLLQDVFYL